MVEKAEVFFECVKEINQRISFFQKILTDLSDGAKNDAKSSAGDKHETSLSMMQLEQEKIRKQLQEIQAVKINFEKINPQLKSECINLGSLIKTSIGYFYIAVALGKIKVDDTEIFVISPQSPIASKLLGLSLNHEIEMNSKKIIIQELC